MGKTFCRILEKVFELESNNDARPPINLNVKGERGK